MPEEELPKRVKSRLIIFYLQIGNYEILDVIDSGSFGRTLHAKRRNGDEFAIKVFDLPFNPDAANIIISQV